MYDQDSKGISYMAGFFMLIAFTIAGFMVAAMLSNVILVQITGQDFETIRKSGLQLQYSGTLKLIQAITAIVGFLLPALLTAALISRKPLKLMGFYGGFTWSQATLSIVIMAAALFVAAGFSYITTQLPFPASWILEFDQMEKSYSDQVAAIMNLKTPLDLIVALLIMAFLAALCEEALFRGGLQNFLAKGTGRPWLAIVVTSIIFSLAHFSVYGFLSRVVLGIALGALFHYSGRLWISILAHFLNNGLLIVLLYVNLQQGKTVSEMMQEGKGNFWGLLAIPILIVLFKAFEKASSKARRLI